MRAPEDDRSDEEIADLVSEMKAERPDLDWDNLLMGRLAGPATDDRPDFPARGRSMGGRQGAARCGAEHPD